MARSTGMGSVMPPSSIGTPSRGQIGATKGSAADALQSVSKRLRSRHSVWYSAYPVRQFVVTISKRMGLLKAVS